MHAVVTHVTVKDRDKAIETLGNEVVPGVSQAPGFVAGYWVSPQPDKGVGIVVFESEEAAKAAAERVGARPGDEVTMDSVEVGEVVANA
ncbi:MAG: hypothetical protein E6G56_08755 [Actinobacteria bacterium]|nr:MAG: hypothetical protein E6G56_08755 [Actinomycetota bacterium]